MKLYSDKEKILNRDKMIFSNYQSFTGRYSIPHERTYFTLAGPCIDDLGNIIKNTELDHLLSKKFISIEQLVSFEYKFAIHNRNLQFKGPIWLKSNLTTFDFCALNKTQYPSIVNFDSCDCFTLGFSRVQRILNSIEDSNIHQVLVIFNSILDYNHRFTPISFEEAKDTIKSNNRNWILGENDTYKGCNSKAVMATFSFFKE
jgi:hypothetical protein